MPSRPDRSRVPAWLLAVAPLVAAVAIGAAVLTLFPGAAPETATTTPSPEPLATGSPTPAGRPRATPHAPEPTPHPATRRGMAWSVRDGTLYMVGGTSGAVGTSSRPTTSTVAFDGMLWHELPPIPAPRTGAALGALSDGTLVLAGGRVDGVTVDATLLLEPDAAEWAAGPPMPYPQAFAAYAVGGDRLYLFGGTEPGRSGGALAFDRATSTWTELAPMPSGVSRAAAVPHGDALYVTGGLGDDGAPRADILRYDPAADAWVAFAPAPQAAASHAAVVVGERLWLLGTGSFRAAGFGPIPVYDLATGAWTLVEDPQGYAAGEGVAALVQANGDILLVGALGGTSTVRTMAP